MRLTREDCTPLVAIVLAGAVGSAATAALVGSRLVEDGAPSEVRSPSGSRLEGAIRDLESVQREVQRRVEDLDAVAPAPRSQRIATLRSTKEDMRSELMAIEVELRRLSRDVNLLARASTFLEDSRLDAKIRYSEQSIELWDRNSALTLEWQIAEDLRVLRERLGPDTQP